MSNAPKSIWAQDAQPDECDYTGGGWWDDACGNTQYSHTVEYVRADTHQAEIERLTAALETARADALREAASASDTLGYHCIGCGHLCGDPERDLSILRKSGARSCCPEREIEPLSAAILALIQKGGDV